MQYGLLGPAGTDRQIDTHMHMHVHTQISQTKVISRNQEYPGLKLT